MKTPRILRLLSTIVLTVLCVSPMLAQISSPTMVGCNLSGGEFGSNNPGVLNTDYFYPSASHYDWCKGQAMSLVRIPFKWERIQYQDASGTGTLNSFLNTPDITAIDNSLNLAESRGMRYMLDMHNYGGRSLTISGTAAGYKIGTAQLPISTYANTWRLLAQHFAGRSALWGYDIMNEPNGIVGGEASWQAMAQAAVNAIRQVDTVHPIVIEGYLYAQSSSWATNGAPLINITDPANNLIFQAHSYWDYDGSGTWGHGGTVQAELVSSGKYPSVSAAYQVGVDRLTPFVSWCVTNNVKCILGEFGSPMAIDTADWDIVLDNAMNYIKTSGNGLVSTTQWGGGAWSTTYTLRMENRKDNSNPPPVASVVSKYVTDAGSNWWFPFTWYHNTVSVSADYSFGYAFASPSPGATCTFNTADTSTHYTGGTTTQSSDLNYTIPVGGSGGAGMHIRGPLTVGAVGGVDLSKNFIANHVLSFWAVTSTPGASPSITLGTTADSTGVDTGSDTGTGNWISLASLAPLTSTWHHYEIPLSQIMNNSISGKPLERVRIAAYPADGNTYDVHFDQVTIQVASTEAPPTITLAAPGGSSYTIGQNFTLTATPAVSNSDNSVSYVEFYINGASVGTASAAPYQLTTSLASAGSYSATAIVWDGHGISTQSAAVPLTITASGSSPTAPNGLTASAVSSSSINLTWSSSNNATSYQVLRATTSGGPYTSVSTGLTSTSFSDTGLSSSTKYYYVVRATNGNGTSPNSSQASATTQAGIPAAPTGLTASTLSSGSIKLTWTASANATSYNILRSTTSGGSYSVVASGVPASNYTDTALAASTTYFYVVQAVDAAGTSGSSSEVSATTMSAGTLSLVEQDIGTFTPAGSASYASGVYTVNTGNGTEIMTPATTDNFSFDQQAVSGDFSFTARVASLSANDGIKAEGAVMIRETLANNSTFASVGVTTGRGTQFSYRATTGITSATTAGPVQPAPYWVRIVRSGNTFTAYTSANGTTWTQLGASQTISMATSVYLGLAVANHSGTGSATFDNVGVTLSKAAQTISLEGLPSTAIVGSGGPYTLNAVASSGLPVSYSVSGPATLSGNTLTLTGQGTVSVTASQAGNTNYNAATSVTDMILVGTVSLTSTGALSTVAGGYQMVVTVMNSGNVTAPGVQLTSAALGTASGGTMPQSLGDIPSGGSSSVTLAFPSSAGAHGAAVAQRISGTYNGGTFGGSFRATLP